MNPRQKPLTKISALTDADLTARTMAASRQVAPIDQVVLAPLSTITAVEKTREAKKIPYLASHQKASVAVLRGLTAAALNMLSEKRNKITILSGFLTIMDMIGSGLAEGAGAEILSNYHYEPVPIQVNTLQDIYNAVSFSDPDVDEEVADSWGTTERVDPKSAKIVLSDPDSDRFLKTLSFDVSYMYTIGGMICCIVTKKLNDMNFKKWCENRWKAFKRTSGAVSYKQDLSLDNMPPLKTCIIIHKTISSLPDYRRHLFLGWASLSQAESRWASIMKVVMRLSKYAEMTHFRLINEYILQANPILLSFAPLKSHFRKFMIALLAVLELFPAGNLPFLKLMYPKDQTEFLNQKNFAVLTSIARRLGMASSPSLAHYLGRDVAPNPLVENAIKFLDKFSEKTEFTAKTDEALRFSRDQSKVLSKVAGGMAPTGDEKVEEV